MADEIRVTIRIRHNKSPNIGYTPSEFQIDQTGSGVFANEQEIGTSEENISLGDITSAAMVLLINQDASNFVEVGQDNSSTMQESMKLGPSDGSDGAPFALFQIAPSETLRAKADTAACKVQVMAWAL